MWSTPAIWKPVQQNGRFTLFSSKFLSIYSILYVYNSLLKKRTTCNKIEFRYVEDLCDNKVARIYILQFAVLATFQSRSLDHYLIICIDYTRWKVGSFCHNYNLSIAKRIQYILEWNLLEKSVKRPFCCTVSILQVYLPYLCYITFWALEHQFIENLKLILKENQIMK